MLAWRPELNTGIAEIDREHQEMFEKLNEIERAIARNEEAAVVSQLVSVLQDYAYSHFKREEHAMSCAGCPLAGSNCAAHAYFIERLRIWMAMITSSGLPVSFLYDIHQETARWVENHIAKIDTSLRNSEEQPAHRGAYTLHPFEL